MQRRSQVSAHLKFYLRRRMDQLTDTQIRLLRQRRAQHQQNECRSIWRTTKQDVCICVLADAPGDQDAYILTCLDARREHDVPSHLSGR